MECSANFELSTATDCLAYPEKSRSVHPEYKSKYEALLPLIDEFRRTARTKGGVKKFTKTALYELENQCGLHYFPPLDPGQRTHCICGMLSGDQRRHWAALGRGEAAPTIMTGDEGRSAKTQKCGCEECCPCCRPACHGINPSEAKSRSCTNCGTCCPQCKPSCDGEVPNRDKPVLTLDQQRLLIFPNKRKREKNYKHVKPRRCGSQ